MLYRYKHPSIPCNSHDKLPFPSTGGETDARCATAAGVTRADRSGAGRAAPLHASAAPINCGALRPPSEKLGLGSSPLSALGSDSRPSREFPSAPCAGGSTHPLRAQSSPPGLRSAVPPAGSRHVPDATLLPLLSSAGISCTGAICACSRPHGGLPQSGARLTSAPPLAWLGSTWWPLAVGWSDLARPVTVERGAGRTARG